MAAIQGSGALGHAPTVVGSTIGHDFRQHNLRIAIVSLCVGALQSNLGARCERYAFSRLVGSRTAAWKLRKIEMSML